MRMQPCHLVMWWVIIAVLWYRTNTVYSFPKILKIQGHQTHPWNDMGDPTKMTGTVIDYVTVDSNPPIRCASNNHLGDVDGTLRPSTKGASFMVNDNTNITSFLNGCTSIDDTDDCLSWRHWGHVRRRNKSLWVGCPKPEYAKGSALILEHHTHTLNPNIPTVQLFSCEVGVIFLCRRIGITPSLVTSFFYWTLFRESPTGAPLDSLPTLN